MRRSVVPLAVLTMLVGLTPAAVAQDQGRDQPGDPAMVGAFGPLIQEPTGVECTSAQDPAPRCKPGAVTMASLVNGKQLYWNSLEGMNQVDLNVVAEYGHEAVNGQSRVLDLSGDRPRWTVPAPFDGGANPQGNDDDNEYLPGVPHNNARITNDGDLFCSDVNFLADGRLIANGGTAYYQEPGLPGGENLGKFGVIELKALWNFASVFDPATQTWADKGLPDFGGAPLGFRGSGFSVMLPLRPGPDGHYTRADFLSAGGVYGVSPGSYLATDTSTLTSVDTARGTR